jgi:hypothetical protein
MAIAYVQSANSTANTLTSVAKAFTSNNTAGNCIIVAIGIWKSGAFNTPVITDSAGNTYHRVCTSPLANASGQSQCFIFAAYNIAAGANTVTCTVNVSADIDIAIHEYSGVALANALDQASAGAVNNASAASTGTVVTRFANEVLFSWAYDQGISGATYTPTSGWTGREQTANSAGACGKSFDQIVSSTGSYSNSITNSHGTSSNGYHALIVSLADTASANEWVQSDRAGASATSVSKAFAGNNTAGHLLVLAIGCWVSSGSLGTLTISDTAGNTWVLGASSPVQTPASHGQSQAYLYYVTSCAGAANTVTVTSTVSTVFAIAIHEYAVSGAVPGFASNSGTGVTTINSGNVTSTATGSLFGFAFDQSAAFRSLFPASAGAGWRNTEQSSSPSATCISTFTQRTPAGAYALNVTDNTSSFGLHAIAMAFSTTTPLAMQRGNIDYDQVRKTARTGDGTQLLTWNVTPPATHSATGTAGQIAYDSSGNYYWCYAANSWARIGPGGYSNSF